MGRKLRDFVTGLGSLQREALGLLLLALGAVTTLGLLSFTHGSLSDGWVSILRRLFGWGAYSLALAIGAMGFSLLLGSLQSWLEGHWKTAIGLEVTFLASLAFLHLLTSGADRLDLPQEGDGGGYVGWALSYLLSRSLGNWGALIAILLAGATGIALALGISWAGVREGVVKAVATFSRQTSPPEPVEAPRVAPKVGKRAKTGRRAPPRKTPPLKRRGKGLPSLKLLDEASPQAFSKEEMRRKSKIIEETLASFGIPAKVVAINHGPVVTQFGVEPGYIELRNDVRRKIRVSKITSLADDIALALAAAPIRIEAPVPGRHVVGIEVPNEKASLVSLRGVMESKVFRSLDSKLAIALGHDVSGQPVVADLATMPHLLVAGATGSGKSVCLNSIATCLLCNNSPDELRLIMIDPKMVELIRFNGLPHLLGLVETNVERIIEALRWVIWEMNRRFKVFAEVKARNLEEYNRKFGSRGKRLPSIVVLIDELADLMVASPDEVERLICRIAQMARATGIHLVIATQRPSVDVVTGLIKANFPARISFAVTSQVDSRVILDSRGAEKLLGAGDMLYLSPDSSTPIRLRGCFVSGEEIKRVVQFWKEAAVWELLEEAAPWEE
ncbi:MAG: DNA translocase FtsK 4TM domain-containing protein, partial [Chloroflexota bacterium]|nr:DNA translocase FtsK 4TM domain-containing protein [Chloroflexota bacterium]